MPTVECPLKGCGEQHEIYRATNGIDFIRCTTWRQKVFFNPGVGLEYKRDHLEIRQRGEAPTIEEDYI